MYPMCLSNPVFKYFVHADTNLKFLTNQKKVMEYFAYSNSALEYFSNSNSVLVYFASPILHLKYLKQYEKICPLKRSNKIFCPRNLGPWILAFLKMSPEICFHPHNPGIFSYLCPALKYFDHSGPNLNLCSVEPSS